MLSVIKLNYDRYKDPLYPAFIHSAVWSLVFVVYILNESDFNPLALELCLIIFSGVFAFSIGVLIATYKFKVYSIVDLSKTSIKDGWLLKIIFLLPLLGLPWYLSKAHSLGVNGPVDDYFINMRYMICYERETVSFGIMGYFVPLSILSAGLHLLLFFKSRNYLRLTLAIVASFAYGFFSTGRTSLFMLLILLFGVLIITNKLSGFKGFLILGTLGLSIFILFGFLYGKGATSDRNFLDNLEQVWQNIRLYLLGGLGAFDSYIKGEHSLGFGENIFRSFVEVLSKLGFELRAADLVKEFEFVPFPTNVYTFYQPYYDDFGYIGTIVFPLLFGIWHGWLYKKAKDSKPVFILLYCLFIYPLCMQFFQDQYFNLLSTWIQLSIALLIYCSATSFKNYKSKLSHQVFKGLFHPICG
jgi:oligosaccharide repeat unit polymerase